MTTTTTTRTTRTTEARQSTYPPNTTLSVERILCPYCEERGDHDVAEWPFMTNGRQSGTLTEAACRNCGMIH